MDNRKVDPSEIGAENEAIHAILIKILEKWRVKIEVGEKELEETIIVSPQTVTSDASPSSGVKPKDTGLEGVASQKETDRMGSAERIEEEPKEDEFLEETIILKPRKV